MHLVYATQFLERHLEARYSTAVSQGYACAKKLRYHFFRCGNMIKVVGCVLWICCVHKKWSELLLHAPNGPVEQKTFFAKLKHYVDI